MAIAFFDLDLTVLSRNSGAMWVKAELKAGNITRWQALRAFAWLVRYHLGYAHLEEVLLESIASLSGTLEAEVKARTLAFYEREVRGLVRPGALQALSRHRARGDATWLLTSSTDYLSEPVVAELSLDGALCNRLEVDEHGRFTGRPLGCLCYGPGKVAEARRLADAQGVRLADCTFYSDSASDLPMLEAVGYPVAVNPDPKLRRVARERGWIIADWGRPG